MSITVYAYAVDPAASTVTGFGNSIENVVAELQEVRAEIALEDGYEPGVSEVYAYDLETLAVLSGDTDLGDLILKNKRVIAEVSTDSA